MIRKQISAPLRCLIALVIIATGLSTARAQDPSYKDIKRLDLTESFKTKTPWSLVIYQSMAHALPSRETDVPSGLDKPLRLCLVGGPHAVEDCTEAKTAYASGTGFSIEQTLGAVSIVTLTNQPVSLKAVMTITESYATTGHGNTIRLWYYDSEDDRFWQMLVFELPPAGEYKIIDHGILEGYLLTAEFFWDEGECHYCEHRFTIKAYRLAGSRTKIYVPVLSYVTTKKYDSFSDPEDTNGSRLDQELPKIQSLLSAAYGQPNFAWTDPLDAHQP